MQNNGRLAERVGGRTATILNVNQETAIARICEPPQKEVEIRLNPLWEFLEANVRDKELIPKLKRLDVGDIVLGDLAPTQTQADPATLDIVLQIQRLREELDVADTEDLSTETSYISGSLLYSDFRHDLRGRCFRGNLAANSLCRAFDRMRAEGTVDFERLENRIHRVSGTIGNIRAHVNDFFGTLVPAIETETFDLLTPLQNAAVQASILSGTVKDFRTQIEFDALPNPPIEIHGNEHRLEQAIFQLLLNSLQAMVGFVGEAGRIRLAVKQRDEHVEICIEDTGPGISKMDLEQVFEPFYTSNQNQLGLGLSVAQHLIESQFQGRIRVESTRFIGTRFFIELPIQ